MSTGVAQVFDALVQPLAGRVVAVQASAPIPVRPRIPFEWAKDFPAFDSGIEQLVEGLLTKGGMSMVYGESNSGKTYIVIHLCICVTLGDDFLGKRSESGAVIYIGGEGAASIRFRIHANQKHFGRTVGRFGLIPTALNLMDPSADVEDLIELIREKAAEVGEVVRLIVVDTVARAMGGGNENASEDMARLVSAGDRIREETGAHVLFVHHSGKDASKGARGHSSLRAALDTEIEVTADEITQLHTARVTKQRDLNTKGLRLAARFVSVELGRDQWGEPVTACAVEAAEVTAPTVKVGGAAQQAVLAYLTGCSGAVRKPEIAAALASQGIARTSVYRALNGLLLAGLVTDTLGMIYRPKE